MIKPNIHIKEKHKRLIAVIILIFLFLFACSKIKTWMLTRNMTEAELTLYYIEKAEDSQGYRLLTSHRLTEEETILKELYDALREGDSITACHIMGVPDTFTSTNYNKWLQATGFSSLFNYDESEIGIQYKEETVTQTVNKKEVTIQQCVYYLFCSDNKDINVRIVCDSLNGVTVYLPDNGIIEDYVLLAPVKYLYEHNVDLSNDNVNNLSSYVTTTVSAPYTSGEGWSTTWYQYEFPLFLDVESPGFLISTTIGTYETYFLEYTSGGYSSSTYNTVLAVITDEQVEAYLAGAETTINKIFSLLQEEAGEEKLGKYLLSSSIMNTLTSSGTSTSGNTYEKYKDSIESVSAVSLFLSQEAEGTLPLLYNCRIAEEDGIIMKVNASIQTSTGQCRLVTFLHMRYLDGTWKLVDMDDSSDNSIFFNITIYDPQW